jgi:hypothetical protein
MYQNITKKSKFCHYLDSFKYHTCNINNSCDYLGSLGLFVASKEAKAITATVSNFGSCFNGSYFIGITSKHSITLEKSLASKSMGKKGEIIVRDISSGFIVKAQCNVVQRMAREAC